jgi:hypothetical protein
MYKVFFTLLSLLFIGFADCKQFHGGIFVFTILAVSLKLSEKETNKLSMLKVMKNLRIYYQTGIRLQLHAF